MRVFGVNLRCLFFLLLLLVLTFTVTLLLKCAPGGLKRDALISGAGSGQGQGQSFSYYQSLQDEEPADPRNEPPHSKALKEHSNFLSKKDPLSETYPFSEEDRGQGPDGHLEERLPPSLDKSHPLTSITCDINDGKDRVPCKRQGKEVFLPFSFVQKYFEVSGSLSETEGTFKFHHSLAKIYRPSQPYNPKGIFTYFENYNVEVRERVKCIRGSDGIPISTQWDPKGYPYPIQIAQFGLSHFSKYLTEGEPKRWVLEDGEESRGAWKGKAGSINAVEDDGDPENRLMQLNLLGEEEEKAEILLTGGSQVPEGRRMQTLSWQFSMRRGGNVTFSVQVTYEGKLFVLNYYTGEGLISAKDNQINHALGTKALFSSSSQLVIRDLFIDLQKGISHLSSKKKGNRLSRSKLEILSFSISSSSGPLTLLFDNLRLSTNEHLAQFYQAADWFVANQDSKGGWPIPVRRKFGPDFYPVLEPGWYSAMGQGHALSLLARAFSVSGGVGKGNNASSYGLACRRALDSIFSKSGKEGGVRATFLGEYTWYEEYPTSPSSFVLNGFMYALLGLFDVKSLAVPGASERAGELYQEGLLSLKKMLPLFDTGSGTFYDLRHFTVPGIPPNLARLDYHVTHINQLLMFATMEEDGIFKDLAERWIGYTKGDRAPHN